METHKIFNLIILDASGSMETIYAQALTGVNETLATDADMDRFEIQRGSCLCGCNNSGCL